VKIINFTAKQVLPSLLDKSKTQTIRQVKYKKVEVNADCFFTEEKPPRFVVGEEVKLLWNQRSRYKFFCRTCGKEIVSTAMDINRFRRLGGDVYTCQDEHNGDSLGE